jgi:chloramphenicol-sensitive protein RarD
VPPVDPELARGIRAGIAAYLIWGLLTLYWKQLADFDPFELIGWRMSMAAIVMAVIVTLRGSWGVMLDAFRDPRLVVRITVAGLMLTANWTTYVWAVVNDRVIETALGYFLAPLGLSAVGVFLLGERLTRLKQVGIGFALLAVIVLTWSYGRVPVVALILAVTWSSYGLLKRRVPLGPMESLAGETFALALPALALVVWGAGRSDGIPATASTVEWAMVLGLGVITAVPLLLFAVAAKSVPFTVLGPLNYLVPIINFVLGWAVFGEPLPADRVVGFALVWLALAAVTVDTVRTSREPSRYGRRDAVAGAR